MLTLRASFQTVFIIALDLSKPWALMDSLKQVTRARPSQRGAPQSSQTHSRAACSAAAAARQWADCLQAALKPKMDSLSAGEQDALRDAVAGPEFVIDIDLNQGEAEYTMFSSDLSPEYVDFNRSEYAYWKQARKDGLV